MKIVFILILAFNLIGCATKPMITYEGELLPDKKVAIVEIPGDFRRGYIVALFDGKRRQMGLFDKYYFLPGEHSMTFKINKYNTYSKRIKIFFNAKAGEVYETYGWFDFINSKWGVQILDKKTKQNVGYFKPGQSDRLKDE